MIVGVVDYGMGNLRSVQSALEVLGAEVRITGDADALSTCDRVLLPGVGSFFRAMENIRARGLDRALRRIVEQRTPLLGICLGMQLLATRGTEDGECDGLGFIAATVRRFPFADRPVPHIGFNTVRFHSTGFKPGEQADYYFVHSYRVECEREDDVVGWCDYGGPFAAVVRRENVLGMQFHPEKSQSNGLKLLKAFLA